MPRALITGSSGLIGSEAVVTFDGLGWEVHGVDNNMRRQFFGADGDTLWNLARLRAMTARFTHHDVDVRDQPTIDRLVGTVRPDLIFHCAAQPSHDLAKMRPLDDFDINARGTLNLLDAAHRHCPESPFVFMSTNKVYGDAPNERPLIEHATRWDYAQPEDYDGIDESCRIDGSTHSLFGVSKLAADVLVQEYGRYFGMPTVCFRGGCLTGPNHSGAELHGFLAYLARCVRERRPYRVYGYKGKQVRDNIHAADVCRAVLAFYEKPRMAAVYNLGGGRSNSISVREAIDAFEQLLGSRLAWQYDDQSRVGDHICYISNLSRLQQDYPQWSLTRSLPSILEELARDVHATPVS
jgi:CDP-paratose 2-epimerase